MSIVYEDEYVTLIHGDCADVLPTLPTFDLTITDPPYEAEAHTKQRRNRAFLEGRVRGADIPFAQMDELTRLRTAEYIAALTRRWVLTFGQIEAIPIWSNAYAQFGAEYIRTGIWIKPNGSPQFTGDRPGMGYEAFCISHRKGRKHWNGGGRHAVFVHALDEVGNPDRHSTQKPIKLMVELVSLFSNPGEHILDPFAGSGTTGVACKRLRRHCTLIERDLDYCRIAAKRLAETQPMMDFDSPAPLAVNAAMDIS